MSDTKLSNDGPYTNPQHAIEAFERDKCFEVLVCIEMDQLDIEYVQEVAKECLNINLPVNYVIEMLTRSSEIATEAHNDGLYDTDGRAKIQDYLAAEMLGEDYWPIGATPEDESDAFFEKFNQLAIERKWR